MTIAEAKTFYKKDKEEYIISKNKNLLTWLKKTIKNGYHSFIDIEGLQNLIDNIVYWYEIKYPEQEMEIYDENIDYKLKNMEPLSTSMNMKQLMYRLSYKQLCLMKCDYRSKGGCNRYVYNDKDEIVGLKTTLFIRIDRKNCGYDPYFLLCGESSSGKVNVNYYLSHYVNAEDITLDELLILFKEKYTNELNFTELEECIYNHNCDIELRRKVLQLVALKLLYSKKNLPSSIVAYPWKIL